MTVKKGGGRRKSLWHGNKTIRLPEHPTKGGGRDSGPTAKAPEAEARPIRTNAADSAANPAAPLDYRWSVSERYLQAQEARIRELERLLRDAEIEQAKERSLAEQATFARRKLEARVKELEERLMKYEPDDPEPEFRREDSG